MNNEKIRKRGILLGISRVDRHFVKEVWLYKLEKIRISIYDPSSTEIKTLIGASTKRSKFDKIMKDLCSLRKANKRIRGRGETRKLDRNLKDDKAVQKYIKKKLRVKKQRRKEKRKIRSSRNKKKK